MAEEELGPLNGCNVTAAQWLSVALRCRKCSSSGCWEHDVFQWVLLYQTHGRYWRQPLTVRNNAHLARAKNRKENRVRVWEDCRTKVSKT